MRIACKNKFKFFGNSQKHHRSYFFRCMKSVNSFNPSNNLYKVFHKVVLSSYNSPRALTYSVALLYDNTNPLNLPNLSLKVSTNQEVFVALPCLITKPSTFNSTGVFSNDQRMVTLPTVATYILPTDLFLIRFNNNLKLITAYIGGDSRLKNTSLLSTPHNVYSARTQLHSHYRVQTSFLAYNEFIPYYRFISSQKKHVLAPLKHSLGKHPLCLNYHSFITYFSKLLKAGSFKATFQKKGYYSRSLTRSSRYRKYFRRSLKRLRRKLLRLTRSIKDYYLRLSYTLSKSKRREVEYRSNAQLYRLNHKSLNSHGPHVLHYLQTYKPLFRPNALSSTAPKSSFIRGLTTASVNPLYNIHYFLHNNLLLKSTLLAVNIQSLTSMLLQYSSKYYPFTSSNLVPDSAFRYTYARKVISDYTVKSFYPQLTPWYYYNIIRFLEDISGRKALMQFYPFMAQEVDKSFIARYKLWLPRMAYYERKLGHRFFLEEAIHILHIGFYLRDASLITNWLKFMILRISFWKTRSIFRFLKYLLNTYFVHMYGDVGIKGIKLKLKGKISVAGNSRKRAILYRSGLTSHSSINLNVLHEVVTINTFTGVMGFQVWLFY